MTHTELDERVAELLIAYDVVAAPVVERARTFQALQGSTLAGALLSLHLVPEESLRPLLEEITGFQAVDPSLITVYADFVEQMNQLIPPAIVGRLMIFPAQMELNTIHVCMLNPTDERMRRALEALSGCEVRPLASLEIPLRAALERHYGRHLTTPVAYVPHGWELEVDRVYRERLEEPFDRRLRPAIALINRNRDALARDPKALERFVREPDLIRLVQEILCRAVEGGASDVHIEPDGSRLRIRLRVDGAMRTFAELPRAAAVPVVARLKAMAGVPIGQARAPVDGQIGYDLILGRATDLRFSLVPSVAGEKVVLRVLDRTRERRQLAELGVDPHSLALIERAASLPNGMLLVTGPTGSGKSSTLYALLDRLNDEETCVLTAEDPVESRIPGVTQVHCDERSGVTFASALRSFLRQDPDVLMVGEIRDSETADLALKSALTGHLVLSTLHTNDAPGAILRLVNMDLEPFIIASALRLVVAQRLVRRLCEACKVPLPVASDRFEGLARGLGPEAGLLRSAGTIYEPGGCPRCTGSGYRGRIGIFEVLAVTPSIEDLIVRQAPAAEVRRQARAGGMRTLREAGWAKVVAGETSIAEVLEHTVADSESPHGAIAAIPPKGAAVHVQAN